MIHDFDDKGFDALDPKWSGGTPRTIDETTRTKICAIAGCDPHVLGQPFSTWSLTKLADYFIATGVVAAISRETLRRILHDGGISWHATTTWEASNDPEFLPRMRPVLDLYDNPADDGRVIRVDEFGPLNLLPRKGRAWRPIRRPKRRRATYTRTQGVRHMLAALDLATGRITYRIRHRKRWPQLLAFLKVLCARRPGQRLYLVMDNYGPHKNPEVPEVSRTVTQT